MLINKPAEFQKWPPCRPFPLSSPSLFSFFLPPLVPGVAALPPGQLKDREHQPNPFSGDRGLKEPRRGPHFPAPELCVRGTPPLKPRRHSDTDKPKGKRPCKTKHTSQREREREKRKEAAPYSPGQRAAADLGSAEDDKVSADRRHLEVQSLLSMPVGASDYAAGRGGTEEGSMFTMFRALLEL